MKAALFAFAAVLAGATVVYLAVAFHPVWALLLVLPLAAGVGALVRGQRLAGKDPVGSLIWFEITQLVPYTIAAAGAALLIGLSVWLTPPEPPPAPPDATPVPAPSSKAYFDAVFKAVAGAAAALITTILVKPSDDADSWVAKRTEAAFRKAFEGRFKPTSRGDRALKEPDFEGSAGWDADGRRTRATALRQSMDDPSQRPGTPVTAAARYTGLNGQGPAGRPRARHAAGPIRRAPAG